MKKILTIIVALMAWVGMSSAKTRMIPYDSSAEFMVTISLDETGNVIYSQDGVVTLSFENVAVNYNSSYGYYCWENKTTNLGHLEVEAEAGYTVNRVSFLMDGDDANQVSREVSPFSIYLYNGLVYTYAAAIEDPDLWQGKHVYEIRVRCEPVVAADKSITAEENPEFAGNYFTTFFDSTNKYKLPLGVNAYVATLGANELIMTLIADGSDVIPANTAVILQSGYGNFTLELSDETPVSFTATNDLRGTDITIGAPADCYRLNFQPFEDGGEETGVGFYQYVGPIPAHSAYLVFNGEGTAPRRFSFNYSDPTGIDNTNVSVKAEKVMENGGLYIIKNDVRYNAQGKSIK